MGGVGEKALLRFSLTVRTSRPFTSALTATKPETTLAAALRSLCRRAYRPPPCAAFKDWNEVLQHRAEITDGKYIREAVYGLKEPPQEETVEIIRMSEVDTQTVEWLWEPYIPLGK